MFRCPCPKLEFMCSEQRQRSSSFGCSRLLRQHILRSRPTNAAALASAKEALSSALREGRLVCGIFNCAEALHSNDGTILACFLPEGTQIAGSDSLFVLLIQASCEERKIPLFKTDEKRNLEKFLEQRSTLFEQHTDGQNSLNAPDLSCFMIKNRPQNRLSATAKEEWLTKVSRPSSTPGELPFITFTG